MCTALLLGSLLAVFSKRGLTFSPSSSRDFFSLIEQHVIVAFLISLQEILLIVLAIESSLIFEGSDDFGRH